MLITVTLNASIDKFYKVDGLQAGSTNRVQTVKNTPGGKGLNVARVAALLGEPVKAMGFVGGFNGQMLESLLAGSGVQPCFTPMQAETRCCINIRDLCSGASTELLEPGGPVTQEEQEIFLADFAAQLPQADLVTISGSTPWGLEPGFYSRLISLVKDAGKPVLLDTSGDNLRGALPSAPAFINPNFQELQQIAGGPVISLQQIIETAQRLQRGGIGIVAVSMGEDGVIVAADEGVYKGSVPRIEVVNTVGCGDSMVAAFAVAMARRLPLVEQIRLAVSVSAANALTEETGRFCKEDMQKMMGQVTVEKIDG